MRPQISTPAKATGLVRRHNLTTNAPGNIPNRPGMNLNLSGDLFGGGGGSFPGSSHSNHSDHGHHNQPSPGPSQLQVIYQLNQVHNYSPSMPTSPEGAIPNIPTQLFAQQQNERAEQRAARISPVPEEEDTRHSDDDNAEDVTQDKRCIQQARPKVIEYAANPILSVLPKPRPQLRSSAPGTSAVGLGEMTGSRAMTGGPSALANQRSLQPAQRPQMAQQAPHTTHQTYEPRGEGHFRQESLAHQSNYSKPSNHFAPNLNASEIDFGFDNFEADFNAFPHQLHQAQTHHKHAVQDDGPWNLALKEAPHLPSLPANGPSGLDQPSTASNNSMQQPHATRAAEPAAAPVPTQLDFGESNPFTQAEPLAFPAAEANHDVLARSAKRKYANPEDDPTHVETFDDLDVSQFKTPSQPKATAPKGYFHAPKFSTPFDPLEGISLDDLWNRAAKSSEESQPSNSVAYDDYSKEVVDNMKAYMAETSTKFDTLTATANTALASKKVVTLLHTEARQKAHNDEPPTKRARTELD